MQRNDIAVIGLGSMGLGMAEALLAQGHRVVGADVAEARRHAFEAAGGRAVGEAQAAARGSDVVVVVVVNAAQLEAVLFEAGVVEAMAPDGVVIASPTIAPGAAKALARRVEDTGRAYLDAPISGGPIKAKAGELTIMASGSDLAFARAAPALEAMAATVHRLGDTPGAGSAMKLVNQLLAGVHIAAACEAMALAIRLGLEPKQVYEVINSAAGASWMWTNRVPHILEGDYSPASAVDIFTKDLGLVTDTGRTTNLPTPLSAQALQLFLMTAAMGMGPDDDTSVVRLYAQLAGLTLPEPRP
ncbi:MAG: NAD(P)-dependent oxidoreductase [Geminicoccaceae bacterium]|nr:MAG: NAD(P)-dependent oxidoreductase [Geminicoccaceae bacterium]